MLSTVNRLGGPLLFPALLLAFLAASCTAVGSEDAAPSPPGPAETPAAADRPAAEGARMAPVCQASTGWRLGELDPGFGLEEGEAEDALREAARLWNEAAGETLLEHDPDGGVPVSFVWDGRHARAQERLAGREELDREREALEDTRQEVARLENELRVDRAAHNERVEALDRRRQVLEERVEAWEARGRPEGDEARAIRQEREEINREVAAVNRNAEALEELARRHAREVERVNDQVEAWNRLRNRILGDAADGQYSSHYREWGRTLGSTVLSVNREVTVWQYDDMDHLLRLLAHELGHVLGVGTVPEDEAVMYHRARSTRPGTLAAAGVQLHPADVEALAEACRQ
ncbi:MAG: hypothetical protein EA352_09280 [Gemmatimonadales bacterium]|nr:MAG: hypothetical protein EA352_09280 [Gemmatimonadales bacterium]